MLGFSFRFVSVALLLFLPATLWPHWAANAADGPATFPHSPNALGVLDTISTQGSVDHSNPFFLSMGSNGRSCVTCHDPASGWTMTPKLVQDRFQKSNGMDPLFRPNDGSNCAGEDGHSVSEKSRAYSLLLTKGLIRIGLIIPAQADFSLVATDDPYHCLNPKKEISVYRRPLPTTNLAFLSAIMWDGRESQPGRAIRDDLFQQARDATLGHAEAVQSPSDVELNSIVAFETSLFTAQSAGRGVGALDTAGARGGPGSLVSQLFFTGINDPIANGGADFSEKVFSIFEAWKASFVPERASIARGEDIFNSKKFTISGVRGLNDKLNLPTITGTCTLCHDSPSAGSHSVKLPIDIGIASALRRTEDMPLYTFQCASGEIIQTTDPGRALITGKCDDMNKMKGPVLRGLAGRAPYFHNGSARAISDVINFYNDRFSIQLSTQEKADLEAFLNSL